jgi:hypothetical protein
VERLLSSEGGEADIMAIRDGEGREYVLRLYREGREPAPGVMEKLVGLSRRRSPFVVNTYEAGRDGATGRFYEIQEYLPEGDLDAWAGGRAISPREFGELALQLSGAVAMIHREGLVHRDIKPDNILLRSRSPLRVALADFGISSAADPSGSPRETRTAATPLYSPPESFAGFAGPAGDWWSLGVVLLECAAGRHPLAGLPLNMVMREIGSRGVRVPEGLDPRAERLLKGLLTRDDRRRWGEGEVRAWLSGRRDVPVHYEGDLALSARGGEGGFDRPFVFMDRPCRTPQALAEAFAASPAAWDAAAAALSRGRVRDWLEENRAYDEAVSMEDPEAAGPDEALYSFLLLFRPELGHVWRGERLSPELMGEILTSDANSPARERIASELVEGALERLPRAAERRGRAMPALLKVLLETRPGGTPHRGLAREPTVEWPPRGGAGDPAPGLPAGESGAALRGLYASALAAARFPEEYVWGLSLETPSPEACLGRVLASGVPPVSWAWYEANVPARFPVPEEIFRGLAGGSPGYRLAAEGLVRAADLMREGAGGPQIFYRRRKASVGGREVWLSPLTLEEWTRYFQFRLIADRPGRLWPAGFHMERAIRDREEREGARGVRPFRGRWAWAGNWGPLLLGCLWVLWACLSVEGGGLMPTFEEAYGIAGAGSRRVFAGNGIFAFGAALGLAVVVLFWSAAILAAGRLFARRRELVVAGAMAVLFVLWAGLVAQKLRTAVVVANLATLAAWRLALGTFLKRRLLGRGEGPED